MSESTPSRRVLHLVIEGFPPEKLAEIAQPTPNVVAEIFHLTSANSGEALEKIFAADTIAVWGKLV